ncbi:MAG TPA: hypothetical protein VEA35_00560 [Ramlibacter sp.]|nr:hypothetical protein [Ramlibacter sp.]
MDNVRELLLRLIKEQGKNLTQVSLAIDRNHAYLQQFVERHVPAELKERERTSLGRELNVDPDLFRPISDPRHPGHRSKGEQKMDGVTKEGLPPAPRLVQAEVVPFEATASLPGYLPIRGVPLVDVIEDALLKEYEGDLFALPLKQSDQMQRPAGLAHTDGAFGFYAVGRGMQPKHKAGDLLFCDPNRGPVEGEDVLVEFDAANSAGQLPCMLRTYLGQTPGPEGVLILQQHTPPKTRRIPMKLVARIYKVLTNKEIYPK